MPLDSPIHAMNKYPCLKIIHCKQWRLAVNIKHNFAYFEIFDFFEHFGVGLPYHLSYTKIYT